MGLVSWWQQQGALTLWSVVADHLGQMLLTLGEAADSVVVSLFIQQKL